MQLDPALISYAGLASLALSVKRHRPVPPLPLMPRSGTARLAGWLLLLAALLVSIRHLGGAQGVVAWIGQTCLAGAALVLLMSWRPRLAFLLAIALLLVAIPLASVADHAS